MKHKQAVWLDWLAPVVLLSGATVVFWLTEIDLSVESRFWSAAGGWAHKDSQPWDALYHYGVAPAWILSVPALFALIASIWVRRLRSWRRITAFLAIVMIVGPGLVVNDVFKKHWGRPRPLDVYQFDGDRAFVPVLVKSPPGNGNSFASGHAATAFYLFTPYFFLRARRRGWAVFFIALGLCYGSLMGLARMIQGAHFLSDVVWAAGLVYITGLAFYYLLRPVWPPNTGQERARKS
jgi:membrane-associated PAP2 superfamily phosphatase